MDRLSTRRHSANKPLLVALFVLTALGLLMAAGLGVFTATPEQTSTSDRLLQAVAEEEAAESAITFGAAPGELERGQDQKQSADSAATLSEVKLQEARDSYLRFESALPGVSIHYNTFSQCEGAETCVNPTAKNQILIREDWALEAGEAELSQGLARAHADLAISRIWPDQEDAYAFAREIIPTCAVMKNADLRTAAQAFPQYLTQTNASMEALKDVMVSLMVKNADNLQVFPQELHTDIAVAAATQIVHVERPEVVVPVSTAACD